jgi:two-component system, chemotaxis family, sensor histidine kinase and response regulator WspE
MFDIFQVEVESQTATLTAGLLQLEAHQPGKPVLESLMRAAHSIKGAARLVNIPVAARVAHAMEDCFVAAQAGTLRLGPHEIDTLFAATDLLGKICRWPEAEIADFEVRHVNEAEVLIGSLRKLLPGQDGIPPAVPLAPESSHALQQTGGDEPLGLRPQEHGRFVRLTAESLNRLLGLAGESLVESRWLRPFADSLQQLKRQQSRIGEALERVRHALDEGQPAAARTQLNTLLRDFGASRQLLADRAQELEVFDRRAAQLSHRLYLEALRTRMRPFGEGTRRFPRMVRDLARSLGKTIHLEIIGENTQVDRDILERLEAPLAHLLRNAVDHGCQTPEERQAVGKPIENQVRMEARHSAGMLVVTVSDDGWGVDPEAVRTAVVARAIARPDAARRLGDAELLQFLFLPGFTLKRTVTEISGRGVGLDVVQNMVRSVRGSIRLSNQPGRGLRVQLQLPLTLSVLRALLVEVAGEPYAVPLSQISRALHLLRPAIDWLEGRPHFKFNDQPTGLAVAHTLLECGKPHPTTAELPVLVLGDHSMRYGLVVDRFLGERELVVQPLDPRLGKIRNIAAGATTEEGEPVLILDVDEVMRTIEQQVANGLSTGLERDGLEPPARLPKRILMADDSPSIRRLYQDLLIAKGYLVDAASHGLQAWLAVRDTRYDLVVTDIDMPHMNGIDLTGRIKNDPRLKSIPVLIISDRESDLDRTRGLEAGADRYLFKGTATEQIILQTVTELLVACPG